MQIPETTREKPYIEFRFDKNGKLIKLVATSDWWGGKNHMFFSSEGYEGNTCPPELLDEYILAYKLKKVKQLEREIKSLTKTLNRINSFQSHGRRKRS